MNLEELEKEYKKLGREIEKMKKEKKEVTSWYKLKEINGFYIDKHSYIVSIKRAETKATNKNICHTREQTESQLAFAMLTQLRDKARQGWTPDWNNSSKIKYIIKGRNGWYTVYYSYLIEFFLAFETEKQREDFLDKYRDLILVYFAGLR